MKAPYYITQNGKEFDSKREALEYAEKFNREHGGHLRIYRVTMHGKTKAFPEGKPRFAVGDLGYPVRHALRRLTKRRKAKKRKGSRR